jgi:uncharacterized membrane protein
MSTIPFSKTLLLYALTVPVFFAVDLVWLGLIAQKLYKKNLGHLMAEKVVWPAAILFYLLFIAGILFFCVMPALEKQSAGRALLTGILFGLFTYATYDLTNLATMRNWPVWISVVDILWGMTLTGITAFLSYLIGHKLLVIGC